MDPQTGLALIRDRIATVRQQLVDHDVYRRIDNLPALRVFMQHHVFAVWDFMSLLKALQRHLTCVDLPWLPTSERLGCRLVNEIVLGEESDQDGQGGFASHFKLYLRSMRQCGASTREIDRFVAGLRAGQSVPTALAACEAPPAVRAFVTHTFEVIAQDDLPSLAAVFTFGREDLLPELFAQIVRELNDMSGGDLQGFIYYLQRHIELDGEEHGPLAQQLIASLCGDNQARWEAAARSAHATLASRKALWDGISTAIASGKRSEVIS
jgi:hypothetical protein